MRDRKETADVLFVGGGVIALSAAFELLERGREVTILDRSAPGLGASSVAAGMLAPTSEALLEHPKLISFGLESLRMFPDFVARVESASGGSCRYRRDGTLWVALHRDHELDLQRLHEVQNDLGLEATDLSADEVRHREPRLSPSVVSGLFVSSDHQVDNRAMMDGLTTAVRNRGGTISSGFHVTSIWPEERGGGAIIVSGTVGGRATRCGIEAPVGGEPFEFSARQVVLAAGAWSSVGIESPLPSLGVRPVKGQILRLAGEELIRHVIFTPDVYLVPREGGELIVGATMEEHGFDDSATAGGVRDLLRRAFEVLPGVDELEIRELAASFRPATRDHMPVLGPSNVDGLFVATGHYRSGILLAPGTAHHLANMLEGAGVPESLEPFTMERLISE